MQQHWCLDATAEAAWRRWDGECVVHHALSNDTHRLSELAGELLERLHREAVPWTSCALADACDADVEDIDATLHGLAEIGLVLRC
ncbi:HPr-rel-A system PqqD family peptide chaperone [Aquincola sp. S2]|uniref:HPr-rel-A system PqqD family peptide chaperone n=1 Tax=Pseudaquabacterium terrae TaxID=2732868 RepID=A0ABX2EDM5_9BURK|nr:HPr-rel-A system PqqD family peptide chaperone [Aquabacterium terrae]NRF66538.1 HPr-rel-A system PqqD family peptide chaperone [Aquabacterium terrae]